MATLHGKNAALYMGTTTATPVTETTEITISFGADFAEDSAHGDSNKSYVPGMTDFQMGITKFYDTVAGTNTLRTAALAGTTLRFYLYPNRATTGQYFYGLVFITLDDLPIPRDNLVSESYSCRAAGTIAEVFA